MPYYNYNTRNSLTSGSSSSVRILDEEEQESTGLAPPLFNIISGQRSFSRKNIFQSTRRRRALNYKQSFGNIYNLIYGSNDEKEESKDSENSRGSVESDLGCSDGTCVDDQNDMTPPTIDSFNLGIPSATNESMDDVDDISNGSGISSSNLEDDEKM